VLFVHSKQVLTESHSEIPFRYERRLFRRFDVLYAGTRANARQPLVADVESRAMCRRHILPSANHSPGAITHVQNISLNSCICG
jgi:hypothetical protein